MNTLIKHIKRLRAQHAEKLFKASLVQRDSWMVSAFNLPELSDNELKAVKSAWPFVEPTNDDLIWNRMYKRFHGFDPYYVSDYQVQPIYRVLNPSADVEFLKNKALIDIYCHEIPFPKTYLKCINGCLYDSNGELVREKDIIDLLQATGETNFIIKPSIDSGCGRGVRKISLQDRGG